MDKFSPYSDSEIEHLIDYYNDMYCLHRTLAILTTNPYYRLHRKQTLSQTLLL